MNEMTVFIESRPGVRNGVASNSSRNKRRSSPRSRPNDQESAWYSAPTMTKRASESESARGTLDRSRGAMRTSDSPVARKRSAAHGGIVITPNELRIGTTAQFQLANDA